MSNLEVPIDGSTFGIEDEKRSYRLADLEECGLGYDIAKLHGVDTEFKKSVFEVVTGVLTIDMVKPAIEDLCRRGLELALSHGCLPVDSSMPLNPPEGAFPRSPDYRYLIQDKLALGLGDPSPTGVHVHVNVHDEDKRVEVRDRLSAYEHLLVALTAGSPFEDRFYTRLASVRTERFGALHTAFDPFWTGTMAGHQEHLRMQLRATGLYDMDPEPAVFRYAHPRTRVSMDEKPTVELRTLENALTRDDFYWSVLLAIGLTNRVIQDIEDGHSPAAQRDVHIEHRAMRKRALMFGMSDLLHDPATMERKPAWEVASDFFRYIEPGLWRVDPSGVVVEEFRHLTKLVEARGAAAQRLVAMHDAVYKGRVEAGLPVANYERFKAGREPMTVGTARDLTALVVLNHQYGDLEIDNTADLVARVREVVKESQNGIEIMSFGAREILEHHGASLERATPTP